MFAEHSEEFLERVTFMREAHSKFGHVALAIGTRLLQEIPLGSLNLSKTEFLAKIQAEISSSPNTA